MFLSFRCANFRSIAKEQELTLVAQKTRSNEHDENLLKTPIEHETVVRCAAIYGANASGKTNILRAMRAFSDMISESQRKWQPTGGVPTYDPFMLDEKSRSEPTRFEIDVAIQGKILRYSFSFNERVIVDELLMDITNRQKILFHRTSDGSNVKITFPGRNLGKTAEEQKLLELIRLQTRQNSLFMSSAAQGNHEELSVLYKWISDSFFILSPRDQTRGRFTAEMCSADGRKEQIKKLLLFADTGIVDLEVTEEDAPEAEKRIWDAVLRAMKEVNTEIGEDIEISPFEKRRPSVTMIHKGAENRPYPLNFQQESAGTRAFFYMLGPILNELSDGTVLLIDEIESSLHPNLAKQFVRIFNSSKFNPNGAQLIFATHDTNLLDLRMLRRDQIWFAEKKDGATVLGQLSDYQPRKEQNIATAYLHGRFGAVPFLDDDLLFSAFNQPSSQSADIEQEK